MQDSGSSDELQVLIRRLIERIGEPSDRALAVPSDVEAIEPNLLADALRATLLALGESLGECRMAVPFSPLHPVIDAQGNFKWCCNHDPEHCHPGV